MNLLLLLSALLSALSGLSGSARAPAAVQAVAGASAARAATPARHIAAAARPIVAIPTPRALARIGVTSTGFALTAAIPLWIGRRRE